MSNEPIRVVIVDDDPSILALVETKLKYHPRIQIVGSGANGREALQLANQLHPDVMVLDVNMPVLNGLEATARITRIFPSIGVVLLTSEEAPEVIKEALRAGAKEYLSKATELPRIAQAIEEADVRRERSATARGLAHVWAFYGPKGTAGTTTLAVNTAMQLVELGHSVVLVDLDLAQGDCSFQFDIKPTPPSRNLFQSIDQLAEVNDAVMDGYTRRFRPTHSVSGTLSIIDSPCAFLPLPERFDEGLLGVFDYLLAKYQYVVVDLPPGRIFDPSMVFVLDFCERLFVVTNTDMSSWKSFLGFVTMLSHTSFDPARISLLLSPLVVQHDFDPQADLSNRQVDIGEILDVPLDIQSCAASLRKGVPPVVLFPESPLSRFVDTLLSRRLKVAVTRATRRWSGWTRLLRIFSS